MRSRYHRSRGSRGFALDVGNRVSVVAMRERGKAKGLRWLAAAAAILVLAVAACELVQPNQPRASCATDADCEANGRGDRFCIQGHCVQCLTSESCGGDNICSEGTCFTRCKAARDCPDGGTCSDGFCALPPAG